MPGRRRTSRQLLATTALGVLLAVGALPAAAAPSLSSATLGPHLVPAVALGTHELAAALHADSSPEPGVSPTRTTTPAADEDESEGLPWTGIAVGGGLGLLAGIVLMVLSKRRENRG